MPSGAGGFSGDSGIGNSFMVCAGLVVVVVGFTVLVLSIDPMRWIILENRVGLHSTAISIVFSVLF